MKPQDQEENIKNGNSLCFDPEFVESICLMQKIFQRSALLLLRLMVSIVPYLSNSLTFVHRKVFCIPVHSVQIISYVTLGASKRISKYKMKLE